MHAGGIGWLATGPLNTEQTRPLSKKSGSSLTSPSRGRDPSDAGAREKRKYYWKEGAGHQWSLGKCDWIAERAHKYGGKVIATVVTEKHAIAAEKQGADALQVTGHEAAAHGGMVTSLVLVPALSRR